MSTKTSRLITLRDELVDSFAEAPLGIVKFSAIMKRAAPRILLDEGKRNEITLLLARRVADPRAYVQVSPNLLELMEQNSSRDEAVADYACCLFGKALSSVFVKNVPKYRNEAARRTFFENLATFSEIVHPVSIEEMFSRLERSGTENRHLYEMLLSELKQLLRSKWHSENELEAMLRHSERELDDSTKAMEGLCGFARGDVGNYMEAPRVCSFFDPCTVDDQRTTYWGTRHYPILNSLNIQPHVLFFDQLRRGLIARDVARMFTPRVMEKMDRSYEQSEYCAYRILENPFESEFWKLTRHGLREDSKRYEGIDYFEEWNQITGGDFIRKMFSRLESISRFRSQIDLSEYETIADSLTLKPKRVKLDETDLKILDLMSKDPLASVSQIAQKIGLSLPTVQKTVRDLEARGNAWPFLIVDTNRFGVTGFLLMLKTRTGLAPEVAEELWKVPYCGRVYRTYGRMDLLAYFNIPSGNETFIHEFASQLKRAEVVDDFLWYGITDYHYSFNPRYYSSELGEWNVYWDEWGLWLKEYLSTRAWRGALIGQDEKPTNIVKMNKIDLQLINILRMNPRTSFSDVGSRIGVSGAYVGQRVRRLLNLNVVQPRITSYRIGLDDAVWAVLDCDRDTTRALVAAFNELPMWQGFSVKGDINGIASIVYVPTGEVQELFRIFDKYLIEPRLVNDYSLHVIEKWTGMRRWLPIHLYSNDKGWTFESNRYMDQLKKDLASMTS